MNRWIGEEKITRRPVCYRTRRRRRSAPPPLPPNRHETIISYWEELAAISRMYGTDMWDSQYFGSNGTGGMYFLVKDGSSSASPYAGWQTYQR
ncbi:hypothetical protein DPSP01_011205 [Paraphaeosphaeria sporulosa]